MSWRAFIFVFLFPAFVSAQVAPLYTLPGEDKIVVVKKGQDVPFDGQLFSPETALRWASWLEQYQARLGLDVAREKELGLIEVDYQKDLLEAQRRACDASRTDLLARLERSEKSRLTAEEAARNPAWYRTREFGLVLGIVGTVAAVGLSVLALEARDR